MDIQFVFDGYACAMYIVLYISKAQKGMWKFFFPLVIVINKTISFYIKAKFAKNYL